MFIFSDWNSNVALVSYFAAASQFIEGLLRLLLLYCRFASDSSFSLPGQDDTAIVRVLVTAFLAMWAYEQG